MHVAEELARDKSRVIKKMVDGEVSNQEPLKVLRKEYLSDGGETEFPWPR